MKKRFLMENQKKDIKNIVKKLLSFSALLLVLFSVNLVRVSADSPPIFPSSFWGTVKIDGANVEAGTIITAEIGGEVVASTEVALDNGDTVYVFIIPGDESMEGNRIDFYIGGQPADQYGSWHSGTNVHLNLSIFTGEYLLSFLPLVVK